jgi:hypothetical protein
MTLRSRIAATVLTTVLSAVPVGRLIAQGEIENQIEPDPPAVHKTGGLFFGLLRLTLPAGAGSDARAHSGPRKRRQ